MEPEEYEKMFTLEDTHWWFLGKRAFVAALLKVIPKKENLRILDVGCGTGGMSLLLQDYGDFYGIDLKEDATQRASKRGITRLTLGSALSLPFLAETFDLITAFDLLYHKDIDDDRKALKEFYRVCKRGGHLLITDSAFNFLKSSHDIAVHTRERYSRKVLGERVAGADFRIIRLSYTNFFLFPLIALRRFYKRYFPSTQIKSDMESVNPILNSILFNLLRIEANILEKIDLPFGSSIICLARK